MRRSRCFVFDEQLRVCEVLTSQNQSVQIRLYVYKCLPKLPPHWGLLPEFDMAKIVFFSIKHTFCGYFFISSSYFAIAFWSAGQMLHLRGVYGLSVVQDFGEARKQCDLHTRAM